MLLLLAAGEGRVAAAGTVNAPARGAWVVTAERAVWVSEATTPAAALKAAGVTMGTGDVIMVDGRRWRADQALPEDVAPPVVQVQRQSAITLRAGAQTLRWTTTASTLAQALWAQGLTLRVADRLRPAPTTGLEGGALRVALTRSWPLTVRVGERTLSLYTTGGTVGAALAAARLAPQGLETTDPEDTAPLNAQRSATVTLHRVWEHVLLRQLPVAFTTKTKPLPDEPLDTVKVVEPGTYGLQVQRVRVRYQDGVEVARVVEDAWLAQPPKPRIVGYGTKIVPQTLQTPDGPVTCWRVVRVYATSYSPCRLGVDYCSDRTFSGMTLRKGIVAVKRSWYAYMAGQKVYVPGYGFGVIGDTGGGLPDRPWVDLGYSDDDYQSWHQWTTLCFVAPPPPPEQIPWILP